MSRLKGRYVAQIIIDIDAPFGDADSRPIAEVKDRFRTMLTPMLRESIQEEVGDGVVNLVEQLVDVYEVKE